MIRGIGVLLICLISILTSVVWGAEMTNETDVLKAADAAWANAAASGNVDEILRYWAEDAVNYFPGAPPAIGKAAIEVLVQQNRSREGFSLRWQATEVRIAQSGELGYTSGPFTMTAVLPSGERVERTGNYVCIWRKEANGEWRCIVETSVFDSGGF